MKATKIRLDVTKIEKCGDFFRTLSHPTRLKILEILEKGPKCVGDIQKALKAQQPPTSHNLKLLTKIGVLNCKRVGRNTFYSLRPGIFEKIENMVGMLVK